MDERNRNPAVSQYNSTALEQPVFSNSYQFFTPKEIKIPTKKNKVQISRESENTDSEDNDSLGGVDEFKCCHKKLCWWSPKQDTNYATYCRESSLHGLLHMGQRKRHMTERIFWLIAFLLSLATSAYLIYEVWDRYQKTPVIVTFDANELDIDSIPFPAVTICGNNRFPKSKVMDLTKIAKDPTNPRYSEAKLRLSLVRVFCYYTEGFARYFKFAFDRSTKWDSGDNLSLPAASQGEMIDFLSESTPSCDEMLRLCMFEGIQKPCSDYFKPIFTDYGKCCTFNMMPIPLLLKNRKGNASKFDNPALGNIRTWNESELELWKKWKYEDGFVVPHYNERPYRQVRPGKNTGLLVLVDPNTDDYSTANDCLSSDSVGFSFILHNPTDMPLMSGSKLGDLGKQIFLDVRPQVTNADDDIINFDKEKRQCSFAKEKNLSFYGPYSGENCMDDFGLLAEEMQCGCTYFNRQPGGNITRICNSKMDYDCLYRARGGKNIKRMCIPLCKDISYSYETTVAEIQEPMKLWTDPHPEHHSDIPKWANHNMSMLRIYFGSQKTVPKLRKRLYGITDLIGTSGGILGLCLGFSILSGIEVIYFISLRVHCKRYRNRRIERRRNEKGGKFGNILQVNSKVIHGKSKYP